MKRVYTFGDGKAEGKASDRNLLGGKGANLAVTGENIINRVPCVVQGVSITMQRLYSFE